MNHEPVLMELPQLIGAGLGKPHLLEVAAGEAAAEPAELLAGGEPDGGVRRLNQRIVHHGCSDLTNAPAQRASNCGGGVDGRAALQGGGREQPSAEGEVALAGVTERIAEQSSNLDLMQPP